MPALVSRRAPHGPPLTSRWVRRVAERMLASLDLEPAELSVHLSDDATLHELNRTYRAKDRPTDVLAFELDPPSRVQHRPSPPTLLGDVVISLDTAERQARAHGHGLQHEVAHLLAHGLLHLFGYDHPTASAQRLMDRKARELVALAVPAQKSASKRQAGRAARR